MYMYLCKFGENPPLDSEVRAHKILIFTVFKGLRNEHERYSLIYINLSNISTKYIVMCKVYADFGGTCIE